MQVLPTGHSPFLTAPVERISLCINPSKPDVNIQFLLTGPHRFLIELDIDSEKPREDEPIEYVCMYVTSWENLMIYYPF